MNYKIINALIVNRNINIIETISYSKTGKYLIKKQMSSNKKNFVFRYSMDTWKITKQSDNNKNIFVCLNNNN